MCLSMRQKVTDKKKKTNSKMQLTQTVLVSFLDGDRTDAGNLHS